MKKQPLLSTTGNVKHYQQLLLILLASVLSTGCVSTTTQSSETITSNNLNRTQDPKEIARVRTTIASELIREHKLDDAKRQLEQALQADSRYAPAYDMMGILLQQEGSSINLQKADSYFQKAIGLDPNFVQARNNYGVYLAQQNRFTEAIQQFEIAGATLGYEGRASALENLGRTALKMNNETLAIQSFTKALNADRYSVVARSEMVDIFLKQGKINEASQLHNDLLKLLNEHNLDPRTLTQGIRLANMLGNKTQQQKMVQQLFDLHPLSNEAKQVRTWLSNPAVKWK